MSEQNLSDQFFTNEESGIPIPPADQGWMAMQHMLDKAMPVKAPSSPATPKPGASSVMKVLLKSALISGAAATISATAFWVYKQHKHAPDTRPAIVKPVTNPAVDTISSLIDTSQAAIQASLPADSIYQVDAYLNTYSQQTDTPASDYSYNNTNKTTESSYGQTIIPTHPTIGNPEKTNESDNITGTVKRSTTALSHPTGQASNTAVAENKEHTKTAAINNTAKKGANLAATTNQNNNTTNQLSAADLSKDKPLQASGSKESATKTGKPSSLMIARRKPTATASQANIHSSNNPNRSMQSGGSKGSAAQTGKTSSLMIAGRKQTAVLSQADLPSSDTPQDITRQSGIPQNTPAPSGAKQPLTTPQLPAQGFSPAASGVGDHRWVLEPVRQPDQSRNIRLLHSDGDRERLTARSGTKADREDLPIWRIYGQLNVAAPIQSGSYYLSGPTGTDQSFRYLIPILRVERKLNNGALSFDAIPLLSTTVNDTVHHYTKTSDSIPRIDTAWSVKKRFGYGFALQYHYFLTEHLTVSAGAQLSIFNQALIKQTIGDSIWVNAPEGLRSANNRELDNLIRTRISGVVEVYYSLGKWQGGIKTILPVNVNLNNGWNPKNPVRVEFLIRRRLIGFK